VRDDTSGRVRATGVAAAVLSAAAFVLPLCAGPAEGALPTLSASNTPDPTLRTYFSRLRPVLANFRAAYARADAAFTKTDPEKPALLATRLGAVSKDFSAVASAFRKVTAPESLRGAHRSMVTSIELDSRVFGVYADAWKGFAMDGDLGRLERRRGSARQLGQRAEILQRRWAAAVVRAGKAESISVPATIVEIAGG